MKMNGSGRSRTMATVSSVAVVALVCFVLGFVALNHEARFSKAVSTVRAEAVPVQARRSNIETSAISHLLKLEETSTNDEAKFEQDLKNLVASDGAEAVTRKQMQEISGKIASAVRASHNSMDVRHLQEVGSPKPCGPKRVGVVGPKTPRRPCIPRPSPTPPNAVGVCKLCVVYQFPVTDAAKDTICKPSTAALILTALNSALLNKFPALFNQIGGDIPTCRVEKQGQVQYAIHGPYCRGPVDPADYPDSETLSSATQAVQSKVVTMKLATTQATCFAPTTYATSVTPVGTSIQFLTVTLECDDGQGVTPTQIAAACP